jgi:TonB family protein
MIATDYQNTNRPLALILTFVFHGLLVLLFVFLIFHTPIPPYPEVGGGGGLEVNFGNTDFGSGNNNSEQLIALNTKELNQSSDDNNVITQESEDNPAVSVNKNKNKTSTVNNKIKINDPVVNPLALYPKKNSGDGNSNKNGNQGKETGDKNSTSYTGDGGTGGGKGGGNGPGNGPGDGPGVGPGKGGGISYKLDNRKVKSIPKPNYNSKDEGLVVVDIWVDKKGNVTKAVAGARGTTTTNNSLWKLAVEAAKRAKFDVKADAPEEQKGQITYNFINLN